MKGKSTIRVKLILTLLASVGLAGLCILILCVFMVLASASMPFAIFFNKHVIWFIILFIIIFSVLTLSFFVILVKNKILYIESITKSLHTIAAGNLDINIPVKTNDELGEMAKTVNYMAGRLKSSMEEERRIEQTKNDLITNISHDLRTPLTSVIGYLDLITKMNYTEEEKLRKYSKLAYSQCTDLKVLIEELFEFTKLNNSGIKLNLVRFSIRELLEQVLLGFMPVFKTNSLELRLKLPDEKISVEADPLLIKRVLENLIGNTVNYGKTGRYVDVELLKENSVAIIKITNYGEIIPDEDLPHIFEKFYRVDKARTNPAGGSGLGLAIVKSIIQLHQGSVTASNADNKTTFEVRLPILYI